MSGGKSSRMGTDKAFLKLGEKTFIENAAETLELNCEELKIVLNKSQNHFIKKIPDGVAHIFDIYENRGALGGIHSAFRDCKTEFAVILAVDLPFVTSKYFEQLCLIAINQSDFAAVVPIQIDGRIQPLAAIYQVKKCLPKIEEILTANKSYAVQNFVESVETEFIEFKKLNADDNLFLNVNHPQDLVVMSGFK